MFSAFSVQNGSAVTNMTIKVNNLLGKYNSIFFISIVKKIDEIIVEDEIEDGVGYRTSGWGRLGKIWGMWY